MTKAKSATALKMSPVKATTPTRIPNPYSSSPKKNAEEKKNSHNIIPLVDNDGTPYGWAFEFYLMPRILSKTFQTGMTH
jgi:hypothetical protein